MANDAIPIYEPGQTVTCHCDIAVIGKRMYKQTGNQGKLSTGLDTDGLGGNIRVGAPTANGRVFGLANRDVAAADKVGMLRGCGLIVPAEVSAAVAFGDELSVNADGTLKVALTTQVVVAVCRETKGSAGITAVELLGPAQYVKP